MFLDKKGNVFGKFNIIDVCVIIVLIAAAIGISARFMSSAAKNAREKVKFSYVVEIDGVRQYTVLVEIEGEGKESDNSYFVGNDVELSVGSTMSMTTKYANSSGKVKSIDIID